MDITQIIKKLDISAFKVVILRLFGGADSVYEYVADKANTAINALMEANGVKVQQIREKLETINAFMQKYIGFLPSVWIPYAQVLNDAIFEVYKATEDNSITKEERVEIINKARIAYSEFVAD